MRSLSSALCRDEPIAALGCTAAFGWTPRSIDWIDQSEYLGSCCALLLCAVVGVVAVSRALCDEYVPSRDARAGAFMLGVVAK